MRTSAIGCSAAVVRECSVSFVSLSQISRPPFNPSHSGCGSTHWLLVSFVDIAVVLLVPSAAACMSLLPSAGVAAAASQSAAGSSCAACRSPELAAVFGLSDGLSVAGRSVAGSERATAAGGYGTARHKLQQAATAIGPLLQLAQEQHNRQVRDQQRCLLVLQRSTWPLIRPRAAASTTAASSRSSTATVPSSAALSSFPLTSTVSALRLLQSHWQRDSARIDELTSGEQRGSQQTLVVPHSRLRTEHTTQHDR